MHKIFLVGPGLIGSALLGQIGRQRDVLRDKYGIDLAVLGIMDSKRMYFAGEGVDLGNWEKLLDSAEEEADLDGFLSRAEEYFGTEKHEGAESGGERIFVDCSASDRVAAFYGKALESGFNVVTPNKKACSGPFDYYQRLKTLAGEKGKKFLYETNVGAGLPVLSTLNDLILTGDRILKIEAILSGTLSYIFNTFSVGKKFSAVVKEAQEKGYTEPDPRDDLNGMDVVRKILILARECGMKLELSDVDFKNLVPEGAARAAEKVEDFFVELEKADDYFFDLARRAADRGMVLRYIADLADGRVKVSLKEVSARHPFYAMAGSDNIVSFTTERYCETPLVIKGPGAGAQVTAGGVFADILKAIK